MAFSFRPISSSKYVYKDNAYSNGDYSKKSKSKERDKSSSFEMSVSSYSHVSLASRVDDITLVNNDDNFPEKSKSKEKCKSAPLKKGSNGFLSGFFKKISFSQKKHSLTEREIKLQKKYSLTEREIKLLDSITKEDCEEFDIDPNQRKVTDVESLAEKVKSVYTQYFHGTAEIHAQSIRANGMDIRLKKAGATSAMAKARGTSEEKVDPDANFYNYLSTSLDVAAWYAAAAKYKEKKKPDIVRLLIPRHIVKTLEQDPMGDEGKAFRTQASIPKEYVLPADHSSMGELLQKVVPVHTRRIDEFVIGREKESVLQYFTKDD